jgi:hypothetical protein
MHLTSKCATACVHMQQIWDQSSSVIKLNSNYCLIFSIIFLDIVAVRNKMASTCHSVTPMEQIKLLKGNNSPLYMLLIGRNFFHSSFQTQTKFSVTVNALKPDIMRNIGTVKMNQMQFIFSEYI